MVKFASCLAVATLLSACSGGCANTVLSNSVSPDGRSGAVIFQRDCGATTGYSTQISVVRPGSRPTGAGNAYVADGNHGAAVANHGGPWVETRWIDAGHLLVRYDANSRIFKQESQAAGVQITYEAVDR